MILDNAISEPFVKILNFHNDFNRNIKSSVGALEFWKSKTGDAPTSKVTLPTGVEPWGPATHWSNPIAVAEKTGAFIAELGIVRAASALEDYITGADAELNRSNPNPVAVDAETSIKRLIVRLGIDPKTLVSLSAVTEFFDIARNCIVHRSGRANQELVDLAGDNAFQTALAGLPKRKGKWRPSVPSMKKGDPVVWQPRHAIMASDVFFKIAREIDRSVVASLKEAGMVRMAAHWCFFDGTTARCSAKRDAQTMVRSLLADRYCAEDVSQAETITHLKSIGKWEACLKAYTARFPASGLLRDQRKTSAKKR